MEPLAKRTYQTNVFELFWEMLMPQRKVQRENYKMVIRYSRILRINTHAIMSHPSPHDKLFQGKFSKKDELLFFPGKVDIYYIKLP